VTARAGLLGVLLLGVAACASAPGFDYEPTQGPYDHLPPLELVLVSEAREQMMLADLDAAFAILQPLAARRAENVPLAVMLQEVELGRAGAEGAGGVAAYAKDRAQAFPTPVTLLLAARLEEDPDEARDLIGRAMTIDPECAWAHYALAHLKAREGNWVEAQERLRRALELDPGLLPGRRLEASFLARDGKLEEAVAALERWLYLTEDDPLIDPGDRFLAGLDLAQLHLLEGKEGPAQTLALYLTDEPEGEAARRLAILAAVEQARGDPERALRAAVQAEEADPSDPLPVLQQAMLYDAWLGDPEAARERWERLLEIASAEGDLGALLLSMRARVELERSTASAAEPR
jgi:tetratricopeptide (TPR) repeat protein